MKKAFTLIEILIVIIIISILLGLMSFLSWSYISKLNIDNEKETVEGNFFYTQTLSLSQPSFGSIKNVDYVGIKLVPEKSYIQNVIFTDNLSSLPVVYDIKSFSYIKFGTGIDIFNGGIFENHITKESYILYKPYTMGAIFLSDGVIYTGNYTLKFNFNTIYGNSICFKLNLDSGRLYSIKCEE